MEYFAHCILRVTGWFTTLVAAGVMCMAVGGCTRKGREAPPQAVVLMISIDTWRADRLSCYGYPKPTTPSLDALAAEGMLFAEAFSTIPSALPGRLDHSIIRYGTHFAPALDSSFVLSEGVQSSIADSQFASPFFLPPSFFPCSRRISSPLQRGEG